MVTRSACLRYTKLYPRKPRAVQNNVGYKGFHTSTIQDAKKAVIFEMGGVILPSPFAAAYSKQDSLSLRLYLSFHFPEWEAKNNYEKGSVFSAIKYGGSTGAWARLERGERNGEEYVINGRK